VPPNIRNSDSSFVSDGRTGSPVLSMQSTVPMLTTDVNTPSASLHSRDILQPLTVASINSTSSDSPIYSPHISSPAGAAGVRPKGVRREGYLLDKVVRASPRRHRHSCISFWPAVWIAAEDVSIHDGVRGTGDRSRSGSLCNESKMVNYVKTDTSFPYSALTDETQMIKDHTRPPLLGGSPATTSIFLSAHASRLKMLVHTGSAVARITEEVKKDGGAAVAAFPYFYFCCPQHPHFTKKSSIRAAASYHSPTFEDVRTKEVSGGGAASEQAQQQRRARPRTFSLLSNSNVPSVFTTLVSEKKKMNTTTTNTNNDTSNNKMEVRRYSSSGPLPLALHSSIVSSASSPLICRCELHRGVGHPGFSTYPTDPLSLDSSAPAQPACPMCGETVQLAAPSTTLSFLEDTPHTLPPPPADTSTTAPLLMGSIPSSGHLLDVVLSAGSLTSTNNNNNAPNGSSGFQPTSAMGSMSKEVQQEDTKESVRSSTPQQGASHTNSEAYPVSSLSSVCPSP